MRTTPLPLLVLASALALPGAARAEAAPAVVDAALAEALATPGARLVLAEYRPPSSDACAPVSASVARPIEGSGRYAVKLVGEGCTAWAWAKVQVVGLVATTTREVKAGEPLEPAVRRAEQELRAGQRPAALEPGALAAHPLPRGRLVQVGDVKTEAGVAGETVKVVVRAGALAIEQTGRTIACGGGRRCAVLPSGRHVEGRLSEGRLIVEVP